MNIYIVVYNFEKQNVNSLLRDSISDLFPKSKKMCNNVYLIESDNAMTINAKITNHSLIKNYIDITNDNDFISIMQIGVDNIINESKYDDDINDFVESIIMKNA